MLLFDVNVLVHAHREDAPNHAAFREWERVPSRRHAHALLISPGPRHWEIFASFCESLNLKGNLIPDAYFAAMAIESGCIWVTTDRDYARFASLSWRHPLQEALGA